MNLLMHFAHKKTLNRREKIFTLRHIRSQRFRHGDARLVLVILQNGTNDTSGRTHRRVQHMHELHLQKRKEKEEENIKNKKRKKILKKNRRGPPTMFVHPPYHSSSSFVHNESPASSTGNPCSSSKRPVPGTPRCRETTPPHRASSRRHCSKPLRKTKQNSFLKSNLQFHF